MAFKAPKEGKPNLQETHGLPNELFHPVEDVRFTTKDNKKYSSLESRLKSFENCSHLTTTQKIDLVDNGFFYMASTMTTVCWKCGLIQEFWLVEESAFVKHSSNSPACALMNQKRNNLYTKDFNVDESNHSENMMKHLGDVVVSLGYSDQAVHEAFEKLKTVGGRISADRLLDAVHILEENTDPLCSVCRYRRVNAIVTPCNHCICFDCGTSCQNIDRGYCPFCKTRIRRVERIYFC